MRHLMNPLDFTVEELDRLFDLANAIESPPVIFDWRGFLVLAV